jgi:hypothetical protein
VAKLPLATDIPWAEKLMLAANSYLTAVVDESLVVAAGLLTMVADKLSAVEPMHNIDSRLPDRTELVFDAELLAVVNVEPLAVEPIPVAGN